jgi:hypothetical protein
MKTISEIKEKIKTGDIQTAAKMLGITPMNASKALVRVDSKHHESLVNALSKVIEMREMLINEAASC